jgi:hypothetical protein
VAREDFVNDGYDPDEIYSGGSKDRQGHSTNLRVHVPDPWVGLMAEIVANTKWPEYRTTQQLVRDAVYHRLRWIERTKTRPMTPRIKTLMAQLRIEEVLTSRMAMQERHDNMLKTMHTAFSQAVAQGDFVGAREVKKEVEELLEQMEEAWR